MPGFMAMRSSGLRKLAGLAALLLLLQGVGAGQNTTLISLDQAIDLALAHNHAHQSHANYDSSEPGPGDYRQPSSQSHLRG